MLDFQGYMRMPLPARKRSEVDPQEELCYVVDSSKALVVGGVRDGNQERGQVAGLEIDSLRGCRSKGRCTAWRNDAIH